MTLNSCSRLTQLPTDPNLKTHFAFLESQLSTAPSNGKYLCGSTLTGADILLSYPLIAGKTRTGLTEALYPKLWKYVEGMENEEGYKKSVAKIVEIDGKFKASL